MKIKGPLITLAVGAVVAGGLLIADLSVTRSTTPSVSPAAAGVTSAPASGSSGGPSAGSAAGSSAPVTSASTAPAVSSTSTYAGRVNGGGGLSIVVKGNRAIAYLCDGKNEAWLWGPVQGPNLALKNHSVDTLAAVRGLNAGGQLVGSVTAGGHTWSFTLPEVAKPSGLYRTTAWIRGATVVAGWVVLPNGSQVGAVNDGTSTRSAPPIDPATGAVTIDGTALTAAPPDPDITP
jgi:hypothetical protein